MKMHIIADSCCDVPDGLQRTYGISLVPLTMMLDDQTYFDDENLNVNKFIENMSKAQKLTSGAPSPGAYLSKMKKDHVNFIVTLTGKLSGSYASAMAAKVMAEEEGMKVHVLDSKAASAGEMLTVLKLKELIDSNMNENDILEIMKEYIDKVKTYFVSEDLGNLIKNGRISSSVGKLLMVLGIRPIMGSDGDGKIVLFSKARGDKHTISSFLNLIKESGKDTTNESLIITHCNNIDLAEKVRDKIQEKYRFKNVILTHTRGLSSMYVNKNGVIMAF